MCLRLAIRRNVQWGRKKKLLDFILKYFSEFDSKLDDINTRCKQGIQVFFATKFRIYTYPKSIFLKKCDFSAVQKSQKMTSGPENVGYIHYTLSDMYKCPDSWLNDKNLNFSQFGWPESATLIDSGRIQNQAFLDFSS